MNLKNVNGKTVILGFFQGIDIVFTVGDCKRVNQCIKVHNIHSINDPNAKFPDIISLSDSRLTLQEFNKKDICAYFNMGSDTKIPPQKKKNFEKGKINIKRGTFAIAH